MPTPSDAAPTIACVIVNWNNYPDTAACLAALALEDYPGLRVIVVDNGSDDGSLQRLRTNFPWPTYIANGENHGFPRACNIGARHPLAVSASLFWLLNNDAVVPSGTVRALAQCALENPRAGVIGAVLYYPPEHPGTPGRVQAWGGGAVSRWTGYNTHYVAPTPLGPNSYITFACALIPRPVYDRLGGLYEGAFMYFEDSDFCLRARAAGFELAVAEDTAILHKEGGTVKSVAAGSRTLASARSSEKDRIITTAGLLFLTRHSPVPVIARLLFVGSRLARRLLRLDRAGLAAVLLGARDWRRMRP